MEVQGKKIHYIHDNTDSKKVVVIAHGFTGNLHGPDDLFDKLSKSLVKKGYSVFRFNFRGTRPSEGDFEDMTIESESEDLSFVLDNLKEKYKKVCVVGESMGAAIAVNSYKKFLSCLVLLYGAYDLSNTFKYKDQFKEAEKGLLERQGFIVNEKGFRVGKKFILDAPKWVLYDNFKKIKCPVFFLHGTQDYTVSHEQSEKAYESANEPKELTLIEGAGHCFRKEQGLAIDLIVDYLDRYF